MGASFQDYFKFLDQLGDVLDKLTAIAKEKTVAVKREDVVAVNECMKREQALSLSLRSMDIRREKMLQELGIGNIPLSQLVSHCPPALENEARQATERLQKRYDLFRSASTVARTTLEINLHQIEKILAQQHKEPDPETRGTMADIRA